MLVWVDCEMTGLDLTNDALIEVAALVTDADLNVLGDGVDLVIKPPAAALEVMGDFVRTMHQASGLLDQLDNGLPMAEAEQRILDYVRSHVPEPRKAPLAGNTIGTDRSFLIRDMPTFESHVHYRSVDVSSIKELVRRWYPRVYYQAPAKSGNHRALADVQESIEELRYYRDVVFVPQPGPDSTTAQVMARRHQGSLTGAVSNPGGPPDPRQNGRKRDFPAPNVTCTLHEPMVGVAQLVELLVVVQAVAGSSPVTHPNPFSVTRR